MVATNSFNHPQCGRSARDTQKLAILSWPFERVGEPRRIENIRAVAILLEVSRNALSRVRQAGELRGPILWEPVPLEKAA